MSDSEWVYVAPAEVEDAEPRLTVPEDVLDANILEVGEDIHWAYEKISKTIIVSNERLEMSKGPEEERRYRYVGKRTVTRCRNLIRVPCLLQEGVSRPDIEIAKSTIPDEAMVHHGERYHFVYREGMAEGDVRSCYLLTDEEIMQRLSSPEDWGDNFAPTPQFF